jgi:hypothetical protein
MAELVISVDLFAANTLMPNNSVKQNSDRRLNGMLLPRLKKELLQLVSGNTRQRIVLNQDFAPFLAPLAQVVLPHKLAWGHASHVIAICRDWMKL